MMCLAMCNVAGMYICFTDVNYNLQCVLYTHMHVHPKEVAHISDMRSPQISPAGVDNFASNHFTSPFRIPFYNIANMDWNLFLSS